MSTSQSPRVSFFPPRPTGVPGLDTVLGGGLPVGDLLFIIGAHGSGKTILALQMAFARVRAGGKALLLTTFSESHDKLIGHLSSLDFFDASMVGPQLQFLSILSMLDEEVEESTRSLVRTVRQQGIEMVIIDGFRGIRSAFSSDVAIRQFLQLLGTQFVYLGTTLVITIETDVANTELYPELTTGDTIIALRRELMGRQHRRLIEIQKLRGQAPLAGTHRYRIDRAGLSVYPRLESIDVEPLPPVEIGRAAFDLPGLDRMLNGGLTRSTATLLSGSPGTGKTLLGLHYILAGIAAGEAGLFVTLGESEEQLFDKVRPFSLDLREPISNGLLRIVRRPPVELDVDELADTIRQDLLHRPVRRLVFDGLASLQYALDKEQRTQDYFAAMVELLRARQVTSLFLDEVAQRVGDEMDSAGTPFFLLSANMLLLRQVEFRSRMQRIISVVKARFSDYDRTIHEFVIGARGIEVGEPLADVEGQLAGIGQGQPSREPGKGRTARNSRANRE
jgi:circadian clock protein KaiC